MKDENQNCTTWRDVLTDHGIDAATSKSLIGFLSWNRDEPAPLLGKDITTVLSSHRGNVIVKDVGSMNYNDRGLLFVERDISEETANRMFDIIMKYEQKDVYKF